MRLIIFANGEFIKNTETSKIVANSDFIIAADGGANHCEKHDITPNLVIGDLDSIDQRLLDKYTKQKVTIHRFPPKKDATDLELALDCAQKTHADSIHIFGALGGRWDMSLANIMLIANSKYQDISITLCIDNGSLQILHPGKNMVHGRPGQRISILPIKKDARGVTLTGFEYPLSNHEIKFGSSIGVSNILVKATATVEHEAGILLCISER